MSGPNSLLSSTSPRPYSEVGGLMLLHHLFKELVLIEVESSPDIWPIADRRSELKPEEETGDQVRKSPN